ncbi:hypothetical protein [Rhodococcus sp. IEGM 1330]|uniref:hypothetical protein n=1 Tax=Rhodococcus sp. IEGM 1330 TaxID=3082225 RepID=UPI0029551C13|nr:hypothetical protein [Rhodococcus sp. IEGM 1330]MDV8022252.1 hypothetical protein [Rhodococcus sp. IEGM 1330]
MPRKLIPKPIHLGETATAWIKFTILWTVTLRGLDYLSGVTGPVASLGVVERAAPLWLWGAILLASCVVAVSGTFSGMRSLLIVGHLAAGLTMMALGFGQLLVVVGPDGISGYRTGAGIMGGGILHMVIAFSAWSQVIVEKMVADDATS